MKFKNFVYIFGIVLENAYRIVKCFTPIIILSLFFPKLWLSYASSIIAVLFMIGGIFYEFKLTDYFTDSAVTKKLEEEMNEAIETKEEVQTEPKVIPEVKEFKPRDCKYCSKPILQDEKYSKVGGEYFHKKPCLKEVRKLALSGQI